MRNEKNVKFYREWLPLSKDQFRILLHLARFGSFSGNLSDLCRAFSLSPQAKNRNNVRNAIDALMENEMIKCSKSGYTYTLQVIPKETEIELPCAWVNAFMNKTFSYSVSKETVIKVLLWLVDNGKSIFTDLMIAFDLKISPSTVGDAKKVLQHDFGAIWKTTISVKKKNGEIRRLGQTITISAWIYDK